jgi:uncharacterized protein
MPVEIKFPGVYVEEIATGVRTIPGVDTSITAFVGSTFRGPVNQATQVKSLVEFERQFGNLGTNSSLGYAVRDFFSNGGTSAVIVRLYHFDPGAPQAVPPVPSPATRAHLTAGNLTFVAASEGRWGVSLRVSVDQDNIPEDAAVALGLAPTDLFNLTVRDNSSNSSERYLNLTVKDTPRRVDRILASGSELLRYDGEPDPAKPIVAGTDTLSAREENYASRLKALAALESAGLSAALVQARRDAVEDKAALDSALAAALASVFDGLWLETADFVPAGGLASQKGLYALEQTSLFNLLCIPPYRSPADPLAVDPEVVTAAAVYCESRRAMHLVDAPKDWTTAEIAKQKFTATEDYVGTRSGNAALYFPGLMEVDAADEGGLQFVPASGAVAGVYARIDAARGVWKAPAGEEATLTDVKALSVTLNDLENGELNQLGINCLRSFSTGSMIWGARTLRGADQLGDEFKYVPVRRLALYIEESLYQGLQWVVFEPNAEPLWAQIRLSAGAFMTSLFAKGAFTGTTSRDAYFVKCDSQTTTQSDIDLGIINIQVGFAPLRPAEFVVIQIRQMAGQAGR